MTELIFSDAGRASSLSRAVRAGRMRRLAHGLYTDDLHTAPAVLVRRHWLEVLAHYCPEAVIADRSARLARPDDEGHLFVVHPRAKPVVLPGLTIIPRAGPARLDDDVPLPQGVFLSSRARALLENLRPSRAVKGRPRRTLTRAELHQWVAQLRRSEGPSGLNRIRDRARALAPRLELEAMFGELDDVLGAALGTRQVVTRDASLAAAQRGLPYDDRREHLFQVLGDFLSARGPLSRPALEADRARRALLPFFEAYLSNFIEGTEFAVEDAARIVFEGEIPPARPDDAHDVLGTWRVVSDDREMRRVPQDFDQLLGLLRRRHALILEGRPEKSPGEFKRRANRAGSTEFVAPDLVEGTLARGFEVLSALADPFSRAVFVMFLVAEVHPFDDGNGRVARVMMNAELHAAGEHRIIIPPVFRDEYLSSLRALTHNARPDALVRVLDFAQRYTAQVDFSSLEAGRRVLERTHAFMDPRDAADRGIRLLLPSALEAAAE